MQNIARTNLETIIIKSYADTSLSQKEKERLSDIVKDFSQSGKEAFNILNEMLESSVYEENYFFARISEVCKEEFLNAFVISDRISDIKPLIAEYIRYIKLDKQESLARYLLKETEGFRIVNLDTTLIDSYSYSEAESFKTFAEKEKEISVNDTSYTFPTGIEFLDTAFNGGLRTGQLVLVSGDYEAGKTTLTTQLLENISYRHKAAFFCFEFTVKDYIDRRKKQPNALFNKNNLYIIADGYDIREIVDNIIKLHRQQGIRMFLIDSQMRIENNYSKEYSGEEKESEKFELLGKLSHKLDITIILIIQTSKADPNTPFKSKKGAHEASIIMHLENVEKPVSNLQNLIQKRLIVKKNKQTGKHFKEDIFLDTKSGLFIKDPHHQYKDANYNSKQVIEANDIDLSNFPNF